MIKAIETELITLLEPMRDSYGADVRPYVNTFTPQEWAEGKAGQFPRLPAIRVIFARRETTAANMIRRHTWTWCILAADQSLRDFDAVAGGPQCTGCYTLLQAVNDLLDGALLVHGGELQLRREYALGLFSDRAVFAAEYQHITESRRELRR